MKGEKGACKSSCGINLKEMQETSDELIIFYLFVFINYSNIFATQLWSIISQPIKYRSKMLLTLQKRSLVLHLILNLALK